jgi:hypothetical protein
MLVHESASPRSAFRPHQTLLTAVLSSALLVLLGAELFRAGPSFDNDGSRDLLAALDMARHGFSLRQGPGIDGYSHGVLSPIYYWILAVPFSLHGGALALTVWIVALRVLSLLCLYRFVGKHYDRTIALLSCVVLLGDPTFVGLQLRLSHNELSIPVGILSMSALSEFEVRGRPRYLVAALFWCGLAGQLHTLAYVLLLPIFIVRYRSNRQATAHVAVLAALASLLPCAAYFAAPQTAPGDNLGLLRGSNALGVVFVLLLFVAEPRLPMTHAGRRWLAVAMLGCGIDLWWSKSGATRIQLFGMRWAGGPAPVFDSSDNPRFMGLGQWLLAGVATLGAWTRSPRSRQHPSGGLQDWDATGGTLRAWLYSTFPILTLMASLRGQERYLANFLVPISIYCAVRLNELLAPRSEPVHGADRRWLSGAAGLLAILLIIVRSSDRLQHTAPSRPIANQEPILITEHRLAGVARATQLDREQLQHRVHGMTADGRPFCTVMSGCFALLEAMPPAGSSSAVEKTAALDYYLTDKAPPGASSWTIPGDPFVLTGLPPSLHVESVNLEGPDSTNTTELPLSLPYRFGQLASEKPSWLFVAGEIPGMGDGKSLLLSLTRAVQDNAPRRGLEVIAESWDPAKPCRVTLNADGTPISPRAPEVGRPLANTRWHFEPAWRSPAQAMSVRIDGCRLILLDIYEVLL